MTGNWHTQQQGVIIVSHHASLPTILAACIPGYGGDNCDPCPQGTWGSGGSYFGFRFACVNCTGASTTTAPPGQATSSWDCDGELQTSRSPEPSYLLFRFSYIQHNRTKSAQAPAHVQHRYACVQCVYVTTHALQTPLLLVKGNQKQKAAH